LIPADARLGIFFHVEFSEITPVVWVLVFRCRELLKIAGFEVKMSGSGFVLRACHLVYD
jgi:hypothetical protein